MVSLTEKNKYNWLLALRIFLWVLIIGGFLFTRVYRLTSLPDHMNIDEAGSAFDAFCLAEYGVDRYGNSWPLYLQNYGTGQSILYVYCCTLLFKLFGYSKLALRLPMTLFSLFNLIFGMKLARKIGESGRGEVSPFLSEFAGLLIVFCPMFIFQSRFGLDCQLMLGVSTVLLYLWVLALEKENTWLYLCCGLVGGLLLYTYILAYLALPVFLLVMFIYTLITKQFSLKKWVVMAIPLAIMAAPLIVIQAINTFGLEEMHWGIFTLTKLFGGYRVGELSLPTFGTLWAALKVIFVGDDIDFSSVEQYWNLYHITAPLFIVGAVSIICGMIKSKKSGDAPVKRNGYFIIILWFLIMYFVGASNDTRVYRINAIYTVTVIVAVMGFETILSLGKDLKAWRPAVTAVLLIGYGAFSFSFVTYYFKNYAAEHPYPYYFNAIITDAVQYINDNEELQEKITYAEPRGIFALPGSDIKPGEFDVPMDGSWLWRSVYYGSLPPISTDNMYIVPHGLYEDYCADLIDAGFKKVTFSESDLYYTD